MYKTLTRYWLEHKQCGKQFFELADGDLDKCPHCDAPMTVVDVRNMGSEEFDISIDPKTGQIIT